MALAKGEILCAACKLPGLHREMIVSKRPQHTAAPEQPDLPPRHFKIHVECEHKYRLIEDPQYTGTVDDIRVEVSKSLLSDTKKNRVRHYQAAQSTVFDDPKNAALSARARRKQVSELFAMSLAKCVVDCDLVGSFSQANERMKKAEELSTIADAKEKEYDDAKAAGEFGEALKKRQEELQKALAIVCVASGLCP